jgi:hypothetical protein
MLWRKNLYPEFLINFEVADAVKSAIVDFENLELDNSGHGYVFGTGSGKYLLI